jgi:hypothetical protein
MSSSRHTRRFTAWVYIAIAVVGTWTFLGPLLPITDIGSASIEFSRYGVGFHGAAAVAIRLAMGIGCLALGLVGWRVLRADSKRDDH